MHHHLTRLPDFSFFRRRSWRPLAFIAGLAWLGLVTPAVAGGDSFETLAISADAPVDISGAVTLASGSSLNDFYVNAAYQANLSDNGITHVGRATPAVPELGTLPLMVLGLGGVAGSLLRRRWPAGRGGGRSAVDPAHAAARRRPFVTRIARRCSETRIRGMGRRRAGFDNGRMKRPDPCPPGAERCDPTTRRTEACPCSST